MRRSKLILLMIQTGSALLVGGRAGGGGGGAGTGSPSFRIVNPPPRLAAPTPEITKINKERMARGEPVLTLRFGESGTRIDVGHP